MIDRPEVGVHDLGGDSTLGQPAERFRLTLHDRCVCDVGHGRAEQRLGGVACDDRIGDRVCLLLVRIPRVCIHLFTLHARALLNRVRGLVRGEP